MSDKDRASSVTERISKEMLESRNKLILEACIAAFLDTHDIYETAAILREFADQLEEFG